MPDDLLGRSDLSLNLSFSPDCELPVPFANHLFDQIGDGFALEAREFTQAFRDFGFSDLNGGVHDRAQPIMTGRFSLATP